MVVLYTTDNKEYKFAVFHTNYTYRLSNDYEEDDNDRLETLKDELSSYNIIPLFSYEDGAYDDYFTVKNGETLRQYILSKLKEDNLNIDGIIVFIYENTRKGFVMDDMLIIFRSLKIADYCAIYEFESLTFGDDYIYVEVGSESG